MLLEKLLIHHCGNEIPLYPKLSQLNTIPRLLQLGSSNSIFGKTFPCSGVIFQI